MKYLAIAIIISITCIAATRPQTAGERFVSDMNSYNLKGLDSLLANNFVLERTFVNLSHTKTTFLKEYMPLTRQLHSRFTVLETTGNNPEELLVQDHSDFFTFLQIPEPRWRLLIYKNNQNRITKAVIDTTTGFSEYIATAKLLSGEFDKWLAENHPNERLNMLVNDTNYLYSKRLMEFRNR